MTELVPIELDNAADASSSHAAVRMGVYTGALLVIVMMGALVAANRIPALERNAISYSLFMLSMLLPVIRFWNSPMKMFGAAMIAWTLFVVAYDVAGGNGLSEPV